MTLSSKLCLSLVVLTLAAGGAFAAASVGQSARIIIGVKKVNDQASVSNGTAGCTNGKGGGDASRKSPGRTEYDQRASAQSCGKGQGGRVLMRQGRVQLDSDWNKQTSGGTTTPGAPMAAKFKWSRENGSLSAGTSGGCTKGARGVWKAPAGTASKSCNGQPTGMKADLTRNTYH